MTIDRRIAILLWLAAAILAVGLVPVADLLHDLPLEAKWAFSGLCTLAALVLFARAAFLTWQDEQAAPKADRRRKMIALVGMIVFGCGFIGSAAWYFWPSKFSPENIQTVQSEPLPYTLSLADVDIILDNTNPNVDLSIGLKIKNSSDEVINLKPENFQVTFNDQQEIRTLDVFGGAVIRRRSETLYNYRTISNLSKKKKGLINVIMRYSIIYGRADADFVRRWIYAFHFTFDPTTLGHGRYITDFEKDEEIKK